MNGVYSQVKDDLAIYFQMLKDVKVVRNVAGVNCLQLLFSIIRSLTKGVRQLTYCFPLFIEYCRPAFTSMLPDLNKTHTQVMLHFSQMFRIFKMKKTYVCVSANVATAGATLPP